MPCIYLINPLYCKFIKIGKWKTTLHKLRARYQTYYGKDMDIFAYDVSQYDYHDIEKKLKDKLREYMLDTRSELLRDDYLHHYQNTCKDYCKTNYIVVKKKTKTQLKLIEKICYKIIVHQQFLKIFDIDNLDEIFEKDLKRDDIRRHLNEIEELDNFASINKICREQRNINNYTVRNGCDSINRLMNLFHLNLRIKKGKQIKKRIGKKVIDISEFVWVKE